MTWDGAPKSGGKSLFSDPELRKTGGGNSIYFFLFLTNFLKHHKFSELEEILKRNIHHGLVSFSP